MPADASVVAVAGRRIDAAGTDPPRFPLDSRDRVRSALEEFFRVHRARAVICSAACGADLLALEAARSLRVRTRIVLPFPAAVFYRTSVGDRPGGWKTLYEDLITDARRRDDLVELGLSESQSEHAYAEATQRIVDEAVLLAGELSAKALALAVWEGARRPGTDATQDFLERSSRAGMTTHSVMTLFSK